MQTVSKETVCIKEQTYFLGKIKKQNINLSSAEFSQKVVMIKLADVKRNWYT